MNTSPRITATRRHRVIMIDDLAGRPPLQVKRTKALLLMIPDDVVQTLPSLKRFLIKEYRAQENLNRP